MSEMHGGPCWFELSTSNIDAAKAFYEPLFGWTVGESEMPDMEYRLARADDGASNPVAGMTGMEMQPEGTPPNWLTYFCVDSADETARLAGEKGGKVATGPADIPGTGRFAILQDPQGAWFGILEPAPMDKPPAEGDGAWNQNKAGRGNWLELMSTDPEAGFDFYAALFGWTKGETMPMDKAPDGSPGPGGNYQLFRWHDTDTGGMMGLGDAPVPVWLPYFGVDEPASKVIERIKAAGGHVQAGPIEVPGPAWIAVGNDPQGAWFAIVSAEK